MWKRTRSQRIILWITFTAFPSGENRIVGGSDDVIENIPWQISLQFNNQHACGGSILNENTILTAAHCVE
jgi:secreted trypsin-like serine protease